MNAESIQNDLGHVVDSTVQTIMENYALKTLNEKGSVILEDVQAVGQTARQLLTEGSEDFIPEFADVQVDVPQQEMIPEELPPVEASQLDIAYEDLEGTEFTTADGTTFVLENGVLVPIPVEGAEAIAGEAIPGEELPADGGAADATPSVPEDVTNVADPVDNPEDVNDIPANEPNNEEDPEKIEESTAPVAGDKTEVIAESTAGAAPEAVAVANEENKVIEESTASASPAENTEVIAESTASEPGKEEDTQVIAESTAGAAASEDTQVIAESTEAGVPESQVLAEGTGVEDKVNEDTKVIEESTTAGNPAGISSYLSNMINKLEGGN